jgi:hypothetical protein
MKAPAFRCFSAQARHFLGYKQGIKAFSDLNKFKEIYQDLERLKDNYGIYRSLAAAP